MKCLHLNKNWCNIPRDAQRTSPIPLGKYSLYFIVRLWYSNDPAVCQSFFNPSETMIYTGREKRELKLIEIAFMYSVHAYCTRVLAVIREQHDTDMDKI